MVSLRPPPPIWKNSKDTPTEQARLASILRVVGLDTGREMVKVPVS